MKITESRLRRIIRNVINESMYDMNPRYEEEGSCEENIENICSIINKYKDEQYLDEKQRFCYMNN